VDWNGGLLPLEPEFRPGGIVFDRILLEELKDKEITFVVKGGPIINDATVEDAKLAGIEKDRRDQNGEQWGARPGAEGKFLDFLKSADVVVSKGQGNYEALSEVNANIFFLLQVKCQVIADDMGVKVGSPVMK
jgi:uncharacterized protein with ATP-grasp and redox domains